MRLTSMKICATGSWPTNWLSYQRMTLSTSSVSLNTSCKHWPLSATRGFVISGDPLMDRSIFPVYVPKRERWRVVVHLQCGVAPRCADCARCCKRESFFLGWFEDECQQAAVAATAATLCRVATARVPDAGGGRPAY